MPTTLSREDLQILAARHTDHEISHDIVALMATVHPAVLLAIRAHRM